MSATGPVVRNLSLADVLPLVRIGNQAFLEHARLPGHGVQAVRYISEHPAWQWGALEGGPLAAFLLTEPRPERKHVALRLVAVDPAVKGRGLGSLLLGTLEAHSSKEGYPALSVGTPFARGFYERNGFRLTKTSLKMIREIACRPVPRGTGPSAARPLDFEAAADLLPRLADDAQRRAFLNAFLANVRREQPLMLVVPGADGPRGVAVGRTPESCRDFAEAVFLHAFDGEIAPVIGAFEGAASLLGLRYVGLEVPEDRERSMQELGYSRSEHDFYWTMCALEKRLPG